MIVTVTGAEVSAGEVLLSAVMAIALPEVLVA
jgi:hypothetical protein